jgi:hypothetical protein
MAGHQPQYESRRAPGATSHAAVPTTERSTRTAGKKEGERLFHEGSEQSETADEYVRTTAYLAAVLFLVGISTQFRLRSTRYGLILIGAVLLTFSVVQLITLPKPSL